MDKFSGKHEICLPTLLQIMMLTIQDEEAELYAKNEAANRVFSAKEKDILERQLAAAEEVQVTATKQR